MSRLTRAALRVGLTIGVMTVAVAPSATLAAGPIRRPLPAPTIATVLAPYVGSFDHDNDDFNIAAHLVVQFPDLAAATTRPGAYTVFVPTDYAFRALVRSLTGVTVIGEADVFRAVMRLGRPTVSAIVRYHVLTRSIMSADLARAAGTPFVTLQGALLRPYIGGIHAPLVFLRDRALHLPDAKIIDGNIATTNGVVHVIDRVLLPYNP